VHPRAPEPGSRQHIWRGGSLPQGYSGNIHDDARPDNLTLHTGKIHSASLNIYRVLLLLLRQRRVAASNGLGTTNKYLQQTTSGAAGIGLGTTTKPRHHDQVPATHNERGCGQRLGHHDK
jgi:hypothetical protein